MSHRFSESKADVSSLASFLTSRRTLVLSGAGISTASGIPDYRGPDYRERRRAPVQYRQFVSSADARRRYWARSTVGWAWLKRRKPNAAHHAVAELERRGLVTGVVTQNVDGLHQASGSSRVIDLHGRLSRVVCLGCGAEEDRDALQERMLRLNPGWDALVADMAPDGDAELAEATIERFAVPGCVRCGGVVKPDVVFFGENVPRSRVDAAFALQREADALLVLGSSLAVFSGYRFVLEASGRGQPVAIVNRGTTRADALAAVRIDARLDEALPALLRDSGPSSGDGL